MFIILLLYDFRILFELNKYRDSDWRITCSKINLQYIHICNLFQIHLLHSTSDKAAIHSLTGFELFLYKILTFYLQRKCVYVKSVRIMIICSDNYSNAAIGSSLSRVPMKSEFLVRKVGFEMQLIGKDIQLRANRIFIKQTHCFLRLFLFYHFNAVWFMLNRAIFCY